MKFAGKWRELEEIIVAWKDKPCMSSLICNCYMLQIFSFVYNFGLSVEVRKPGSTSEREKGESWRVATVEHIRYKSRGKAGKAQRG